MTLEEKGLVRLLFQARIARLNGMAFQNFFTDLMSRARPDFFPVKPQGAEGDWKNDGHEPSEGRYYQVYAPEVFEEASAIKKLQDDFAGLMAKWGDKKVYPAGISEFFFVINDAYRITPGVFPTTYAALESLRQANGLKKCAPMLSKDLEDILLALDDDKIFAIVGFPPNPANIKVLPISLVSEVVTFIVENPIVRSLDDSLVAPDFESKIQFNGLTFTGQWLKSADYRRGTVDQYFAANSSFARQTVRDKLQAIYESTKAIAVVNITNGPSKGDQQFDAILERITPTSADLTPRAKKELQDASIVVMAYFFEACDIFEEPPNVPA